MAELEPDGSGDEIVTDSQSQEDVMSSSEHEDIVTTANIEPCTVDSNEENQDTKQEECTAISQDIEQNKLLDSEIKQSDSHELATDPTKISEESKFVDSLKDELNSMIENSTLDFCEETKVEDKEKKKSKKNKKKKKGKKGLPMPEDVASDADLRKYWHQRYRLFSKFDEGIKMDRGKY